jgi:hypothetical protein
MKYSSKDSDSYLRITGKNLNLVYTCNSNCFEFLVKKTKSWSVFESGITNASIWIQGCTGIWIRKTTENNCIEFEFAEEGTVPMAYIVQL